MQTHKKRMKDKGMYKIILEDGSDLLISGKHRVYANQINPLRNSLIKSDVVNTLTSDCCLRCGSFDQIDALIDNAAARYGASSWSNKTSSALLRNALYLESSINPISDSTSFCLISNSCSESFDFIKHSSLCSSNSDLTKSGAEKSDLIEENKYELTEWEFISEKNTLLSRTNIIFHNPSLFLSAGESCESNFLNLPFLAFLPNSTDHLINSCSSLEFSFFNSKAPIFCLLINSSLARLDQFTQANLDISDFSSGSNANVIDAIKNHLHDFWGSTKSADFVNKKCSAFLCSKNLRFLRTIHITPLAFNSSNLLSSLTLRDITLRTTSATLISGNSSLKLFNTSSGTDTVILGILSTSKICFEDQQKQSFCAASNNYLNTSKYVNVYKSFGFEDFSLMPITDVYEDVNNDKDIFLNENNLEHDFTSLEDEKCMMLYKKMNKIEEATGKQVFPGLKKTSFLR